MNKRVWWCAALLVHAGALTVAADQNIWILLRDKMDAAGQRVAWVDLGAGHSDAELDLPINQLYIERLRKMGVVVRFCSRWLNAVSARVSPEVQRRVQAVDFVVETRPVQRLQRPRPLPPVPLASPKLRQSRYGLALEPLAQIAVPPLHDQGLTGSGVRVALLDNGFHYTEHAAFDSIRVVAQRDFVNDDEVVTDEADQPITGDERGGSQNLHGAQVLSLMAGNHPDHFIGVAPDAEYILAKTELDDNMPEMPSEEDRWVAGLEWADSLGAQVVNSSLGYNRWDDGTGYSPADLDGETALTSVAAALAVRRGIVVVVAAGNEANGDWHYITIPADADGAIAVGAVDVPGSGERVPQIASFSSRGPTADGRIKPDVVAPGSGVVVADLRRGGYARRGGTSFAAPLVSGVCALLLQKNPEWTPDQVLEALRSTALDLGAAGPDTVYGWGQINALAASGLDEVPPQEDRLLAPFPNPARDGVVHFPVLLAERGLVELNVFDVAGRLVFAERWDLWPGSHDRPGRAPRWTPGRAVANGIYFYQLRSPNRSHLGKIALVRAP